MKPALSIVEPFPADNVGNIARMLRDAAGNIEAETENDVRTQAIVAVQIHENGEIQVYGWGRTDSVHALGVLNLGIARLTKTALAGDDE